MYKNLLSSKENNYKQKGITPVVSIILLLIISVVIVGAASMFLQRAVSAAGSSAESAAAAQSQQLASQFRIDSVSSNKVYVRNMGTSGINRNSLAFYADGGSVAVSSGPDTISPNTVGEFTLSGFSWDSTAVVRVAGSGMSDTVANDEWRKITAIDDTVADLWSHDVNDRGFSYNKIMLIDRGSKSDYATGETPDGGAWYWEGFDIVKNAVKFSGTWYVAENEPQGRGCWNSGNYGRIPNNLYQIIEYTDQCWFGNTNYGSNSYCAKKVIIPVPGQGLRIESISDVESVDISCNLDNAFDVHFDIYVK